MKIKYIIFILLFISCGEELNKDSINNKKNDDYSSYYDDQKDTVDDYVVTDYPHTEVSPEELSFFSNEQIYEPLYVRITNKTYFDLYIDNMWIGPAESGWGDNTGYWFVVEEYTFPILVKVDEYFTISVWFLNNTLTCHGTLVIITSNGEFYVNLTGKIFNL